jgi:hypothetical protein
MTAATTVFKALCALLEQDMVDSEYLDLIPYEEVEHPVRRRSSILGFGGSGISSNNLTSGVITGVCACTIDFIVCMLCYASADAVVSRSACDPNCCSSAHSSCTVLACSARFVMFAKCCRNVSYAAANIIHNYASHTVTTPCMYMLHEVSHFLTMRHKLLLVRTLQAAMKVVISLALTVTQWQA